MPKISYCILLALFFSISKAQEQHFERPIKFETSRGMETSTYEEVKDFYTELSGYSDKFKLVDFGMTDAGLPLQLFTFQQTDNANNINLLINNGIHPGESDGIDACMLMVKDIVNGKIDFPTNVNLHIIPSYNIGGMLNRNSTSRANQNGPKAYGFRGNARNFDLNRDFIKMDTKNMEAFAEMYHRINPEVYVETHVSNGADYQYTLTHLLTQHNRLGYDLGEYLENVFKVKLENQLAEKDLIITPYVNVFGRTPDRGFSQFIDFPRYSTGYTALWNTLGLMIETHMLKPYKNRVLQTKDMLEIIANISSTDAEKIKNARRVSKEKYLKDQYYKFNYTIDSTKFSKLEFKGYESKITESKVTGKARLQYNKKKPFSKSIHYYNNLKPRDSIKIPDYYILKSGWKNIIEKLALNNIRYEIVPKDIIISVEKYRILDYDTYNTPYEGHYLHYNTEIYATKSNLEVKSGDYLIPVAQNGIKYLLETLEPMMKDSFFNWNFFDTILQQKEGFSGYVFEDYAFEFLEQQPKLKAEFLSKKEVDKSFASNARAQLSWIYKHSPLYEEAHLNYPVYRVFNEVLRWKE